MIKQKKAKKEMELIAFRIECNDRKKISEIASRESISESAVIRRILKKIYIISIKQYNKQENGS